MRDGVTAAGAGQEYPAAGAQQAGGRALPLPGAGGPLAAAAYRRRGAGCALMGVKPVALPGVFALAGKEGCERAAMRKQTRAARNNQKRELGRGAL